METIEALDYDEVLANIKKVVSTLTLDDIERLLTEPYDVPYVDDHSSYAIHVRDDGRVFDGSPDYAYHMCDRGAQLCVPVDAAFFYYETSDDDTADSLIAEIVGLLPVEKRDEFAKVFSKAVAEEEDEERVSLAFACAEIVGGEAFRVAVEAFLVERLEENLDAALQDLHEKTLEKQEALEEEKEERRYDAKESIRRCLDACSTETLVQLACNDETRSAPAMFITNRYEVFVEYNNKKSDEYYLEYYKLPLDIFEEPDDAADFINRICPGCTASAPDDFDFDEVIEIAGTLNSKALRDALLADLVANVFGHCDDYLLDDLEADDLEAQAAR
ncbi:MAG: hypothetical protein KGI47_10735 [Betaproteobacteria bacterium]|nr:hypothetical protein [Betaproteobacteria bacterium]